MLENLVNINHFIRSVGKHGHQAMTMLKSLYLAQIAKGKLMLSRFIYCRDKLYSTSLAVMSNWIMEKLFKIIA